MYGNMWQTRSSEQARRDTMDEGPASCLVGPVFCRGYERGASAPEPPRRQRVRPSRGPVERTEVPFELQESVRPIAQDGERIGYP